MRKVIEKEHKDYYQRDIYEDGKLSAIVTIPKSLVVEVGSGR